MSILIIRLMDVKKKGDRIDRVLEDDNNFKCEGNFFFFRSSQ